EELGQLFSQVPGVENVAIVTDRDTGQSRGFGFVEMDTPEAANEAVRKFNGTTLGGRTLTVEIAKPSAPRSNSGGRSGGGYRSRRRGRWEERTGGACQGAAAPDRRRERRRWAYARRCTTVCLRQAPQPPIALATLSAP